jgi:hypothetical protein
VVRFTPLPLYLLGKNPRYPFDRRPSGPQNQYGRCGEDIYPSREYNSDYLAFEPVAFPLYQSQDLIITSRALLYSAVSVCDRMNDELENV